MKTKNIGNLTTLGRSLVVLGIIFSSNRLVGYLFIGAGVVVSIISMIKSKKELKKYEGSEW